MADESKKKEAKTLNVCFPTLESSREEKDQAIKILNNYFPADEKITT